MKIIKLIKIKDQKGSTLLFISMMISFLMVMALAVAQVILVEVKMGGDFASTQRAFYGKQAAFELAFLNKKNLDSTNLANSTQIFSNFSFNPINYFYSFNNRGFSTGVRSDNNILFTKPIIDGGIAFSLSLKTDGTLFSWGKNNVYQLGDGTTTNRSTPVKVKGVGGVGFLDNIIKISASKSSSYCLVLKSDGTVYGWGYNLGGSLGDGTTTNRSTPVKVKGVGGVGYLDNIIKISAGSGGSLALSLNGNVYYWGGGLVTPSLVSGLSDIVDISSGGGQFLALKTDGTVWAWGANSNGQLGDGTTINKSTPVQVKGVGGVGFLTGIIKVEASYTSSYALKSDGTVYSWGYNGYGQLGDGTTINRSTPVQVKGVGGVGFLNDIIDISAGFYNSISLKSDGTVYSWGSNTAGQLADGTTINRSTPVQVKGVGGVGFLNDIIDISAGSWNNSYAVKLDGTVYSWGDNSNGQLGDGTTINKSTPVQVKGVGETGYLKL